MTTTRRPGIPRLALAALLGFVADHCMRWAVRLNGTLTRDEVQAALRDEPLTFDERVAAVIRRRRGA